MSNSKIDRIAKLISQAQSAAAIGNDQEAKIFDNKAQQLMNEYNVEQAEIHAVINKQDDAQTMTVKYITVGNKGSVGLKNRCNHMAIIVSELFGIRCDLRHDGTSIIAYGTVGVVEDAERLVKHINQENENGIPYAKQKSKEASERFSRISYDRGFYHTLNKLATDTAKNRTHVMKENLGADYMNHQVDPIFLKENNQYSHAVALRDMKLAVNDFYKSKSRARGSFNINRQYSYSASSYQAGVSQANNTNFSGRKMIG